MLVMNYIHIDKLSKEPIYQQLLNALKEAILSGEMKYGTLLPSEETLADAYGISRVVVRQAYQELAQMQLIESVKGKGSQVVYAFKLVNLLQNMDKLPLLAQENTLVCHVLMHEKLTINHYLKSMLNSEEEGLAYHTRRVYTKEGVSLLIEDIYVPWSEAFSKLRLEKDYYLMDWLKNQPDIKLKSIKTQIKVSHINEQDKVFIEKSHTPVFKGKYQYFDMDHKIVAYQEIQILAQHHAFNIEVSQ
jgi:DNA-binding GntR family transcriptional regulator